LPTASGFSRKNKASCGRSFFALQPIAVGKKLPLQSGVCSVPKGTWGLKLVFGLTTLRHDVTCVFESITGFE